MQGGGFPAVLQRGYDMIAALEPERAESCDQRRDAAVPLRVGQTHLAIDDSQRVRVACDAAKKA